jgi:hypothetical protein
MANDDMIRLIEVAARPIVIVSIGGGADVVIAKAIAMKMIRAGATSVDIVQTRHASHLTMKRRAKIWVSSIFQK